MKAITAIVTGRRTAWVVLLTCLVALGLAVAFLPRTSAAAQANPATAGDSARVAQWLTHDATDNTINGIVVWNLTDGGAMSDAQRTAIKARAAAVAAQSPEPRVAWAQLSPDRTTILTVVPMPTERVVRDAPAVADSLMRAARDGLPPGVQARFTGQLATLADSARASGGSIDQTLGIWLLVLAAVLLILATRSVVLWLVPLILAGASATVAYLVGAAVSKAMGLAFEAPDAALVFAATLALATAYSLVYILVFRSELARGGDRYEAATRSWAARGPGIAVSALILLVGSLVFVFAADSRVRALGLSIGIGVVLATLTVLVALVAGLALLGGRSLWLGLAPSGDRGSTAPRRGDRHTVLVAFVSAAVLGAVMTGGTALVLQTATPKTDSQSVLARASIDGAFTRGYGNESVMIVPNSLKGDTSVIAPTTLAMNLPRAHAVTLGNSYQGFGALTVDFDIDPGSKQALDTIRTLRQLIADKGVPTSRAFVGGPDAILIDQQDAVATELGIVLPIAIVLMLALLYLADRRERRLRS